MNENKEIQREPGILLCDVLKRIKFNFPHLFGSFIEPKITEKDLECEEGDK